MMSITGVSIWSEQRHKTKKIPSDKSPNPNNRSYLASSSRKKFNSNSNGLGIDLSVATIHASFPRTALDTVLRTSTQKDSQRPILATKGSRSDIIHHHRILQLVQRVCTTLSSQHIEVRQSNRPHCHRIF